MTQFQLAEKAGVSQSYIAKLEAKKIEPSYLKVKAILEVLDSLERGREARAREIMSTDIISVQKDDVIQRAVEIMTQHGFSQLPVMDGERPVGSITERTIIDKMRNGSVNGPVGKKPVSMIIDDPFPQVGEGAPVTIIASLLRMYPAVLVHHRGEITGIITKADLLKTIS
ncbi:MAG: CBS domain-containing protein [Candidatus Bathyarchaeota archaeon]|nr:MAG: CBS domain-containing protein [Candidatus Bathyarchaeota archaeon]